MWYPIPASRPTYLASFSTPICPGQALKGCPPHPHPARCRGKGTDLWLSRTCGHRPYLTFPVLLVFLFNTLLPAAGVDRYHSSLLRTVPCSALHALSKCRELAIAQAGRTLLRSSFSRSPAPSAGTRVKSPSPLPPPPEASSSDGQKVVISPAPRIPAHGNLIQLLGEGCPAQMPMGDGSSEDIC